MHTAHIPAPTPVRCSADAVSLLSLAMSHPLAPETLAFLLDADGLGGVVVAIDGTDRPDAVLDVVEVMSHVGERVPNITSLVVATVRPDCGVLPGDIDRWLEASSIAALCGIELLEWYVMAPHGVECPRDLLGEPERWSE